LIENNIQCHCLFLATMTPSCDYNNDNDL